MPKERTQDLVAIQVRMTPEEHEAFTKAAKNDVRSLNMWIRVRLVETLNEEEQSRLRGIPSSPHTPNNLASPSRRRPTRGRAA